MARVALTKIFSKGKAGGFTPGGLLPIHVIRYGTCDTFIISFGRGGEGEGGRWGVEWGCMF